MRINKRTALLVVPIVALSIASFVLPASADSNEDTNGKSGIIYNSVVTPLPGNLPSLGFEATSTSEFGNAVNFTAGSSHVISKVVVTLSSWGCASGSWYAKTCLTPKDANFSLPITLNVYGPSVDGANPGAKLAAATQTFNIDYRPSASPLCTEGRWYEKSSKSCFNGLAQNITFKLKNVKVPSSAIFGITYNTTHHGYAPIGQSAPCFSTPQGCGYDSLNVGLSEDPTNVTKGSSVVPGKPWLAAPSGDWYADGGAAGVGTFRMDSPNAPAWWGVNSPSDSAPWFVPAIKVFANDENKNEKQLEDKQTSSASLDAKSNEKKGIKKD